MYSSVSLQGACGVIDHTNATFTTLWGPKDGFSTWSIVVDGGVDILFYNATTGKSVIGQLDPSGVFINTQPIPDGQIGPGWTNITFHKGFYLFYNKHNGFAAVGNMKGSDFHTYNTWNGSFSRHWTQITSTPNGLVFYNKQSGSVVTADWEVVRSGPGFGEITQVNIKTLQSYPSGFATGWTHVVNTSNGLLFYRRDSGLSVMANVDFDGSVMTRPSSHATLPMGYDSIVSQNDDVLLYTKKNGNVAFGGFPTAGFFNGLVIRAKYKAYLPPGWTTIVATVDPPSGP